MTEGIHIVIEGTCYVGKSMVINRLKDLNVFRVIDENVKVNDYPDRQITEMNSALARDIFFLETDFKKARSLNEEKKKTDIISERCEIGTLSITYSSKEYSGNLKGLLDVLKMNTEKYGMCTPDAFVYVTKDEQLLRKHFNEDKYNRRISFWNNLECIFKQDSFLEAFFDYETAVPVLRLKNEDNVDELTKSICEFANKIKQSRYAVDGYEYGRQLTEFLSRLI